MADQHRPVGTPPPSPAAGVRFLDSGRTCFFDPGERTFEIGDWVVVETTRGQEAGRIVIAPHQIRLNLLDGELKPILRRLDEQDVAMLEPPKQVGPRDEAHLVGGLGRRGRLSGCRSAESDQYQQMKALMPRLGQRVETPKGAGTVMALQILKELVTVRLEADNTPHVFASADLGFKHPEPAASPPGTNTRSGEPPSGHRRRNRPNHRPPS